MSPGLRIILPVLVGYSVRLDRDHRPLVSPRMASCASVHHRSPWRLVLCILPLVPTAAPSTALALVIFPAVLERKGPFFADSGRVRAAKRSGEGVPW